MTIFDITTLSVVFLGAIFLYMLKKRYEQGVRDKYND